MKQRFKLLAFLACVGVTFIFAAYQISKRVIDGVAQELLWQYAQISAHHDAEKLLNPIIEQVELIKQIATHPNVTTWGTNTHDDVYRAVAEETLDAYRWQLKSKNFFIALDQNLAYHFNDVESVRKETFFRYYLEPTSVADSWYFDQRDNRVDLSVNIATDTHLMLTRVWVNQSIVKDGQFLGVVGTGIDTQRLFERMSEHHSNALRTLFVDETGRVQLLIDGDQYHYPLRDSVNIKPTLSDYIDDQDDFSALESLMQHQKRGEEAQSLIVEQGEGKAVVAIHYIAELGWYELTFVSMQAMVPSWVSTTLYVPLIGLALVFALLSYLYLVTYWLLPKQHLTQRLLSLLDPPRNEGEANLAVDQIAQELRLARGELEQRVASRTKELDNLSIFDVVTKLHNRKGIEREIVGELARASREQFRFGLIWIDIGMLEQNGVSLDRVELKQRLVEVANSLIKAIREYDTAARLADGEFLILVRTDNKDTLRQIALRMKQYIRQAQTGRESLIEQLAIGASLIEPNMTMQQALALADNALYIAKTKSTELLYIHENQDGHQLTAG